MFLSHFLISLSPRLGHECSIGRISRMTIHLIGWRCPRDNVYAAKTGAQGPYTKHISHSDDPTIQLTAH